jgi:hypothetical protein
MLLRTRERVRYVCMSAHPPTLISVRLPACLSATATEA